MSVIISDSVLLKDIPSGWWPTSTSTSLSLYDGFTADYETLYRTQPNVRTCVDFLARNIAQLGLHVYRRDEKKGRIRLRDHPLAKLLSRPLPNQAKFTSYKMINGVVGDAGVFGRSYLKKEIDDNGKLVGLVRIPAGYVSDQGVLSPMKYIVNFGGKTFEYDPDEIVHFNMYHPGSNVKSISPLETLRRILAEEHAAGDYRENFWKNAARMSGVLSTEKTMSKDAIERLRSQWGELYSGADNSGKTAILEEGLTFNQVSFNPKDSEYLEGRKLTREECARAYHIPPTLVGILEHATYSNIEEQHRGLYNDVLGPYLAMIEEDLLIQLKDDFDDMDGVYLEFNIQEKLQGDFETQLKSLQSATGAPWLLRNEARDIMNLPRVEGFDEPVEPLNVLVGGQASPTDSAPKQINGVIVPSSPHGNGAAVDASTVSHLEGQKSTQIESFDTHEPGLREIYDEKWRTLLVRTFERQRNAVLPAVKSQDIQTVWDLDRWNEELTADFKPLSLMTAQAWAQSLGKQLGVIITDDMLQGFTDQSARIAAEYLNESTQEQIEAALADEEDPKTAVQHVFDVLLAATVIRFALGRVTSLSQYGAYQAAVRGNIVTKTWVVNSTNPRDTHAAMNGETVGLHERFSNGLRWPGDYEGSAEETVHCECSLRYNRDAA